MPRLNTLLLRASNKTYWHIPLRLGYMSAGRLLSQSLKCPTRLHPKMLQVMNLTPCCCISIAKLIIISNMNILTHKKLRNNSLGLTLIIFFLKDKARENWEITEYQINEFDLKQTCWVRRWSVWTPLRQRLFQHFTGLFYDTFLVNVQYYLNLFL